ncbi:hypothetical protein MJO28_016849 [Puccinia striiformis f. sp. tritici]|uniref:Uncharacterized protein n=1 Tax=Puccinia striiformis TaxID=27350 RepID=A0A2S4VW45_9BASI|nr:hypothetical protein MJO28_016849 [Puccinia striiformis f. sp. tritici]POW13677.1 hypothetical protein PSTT_03527 [Puccinia striiformis]
MSEPLVPGPDDSLIFNVLERERANSDLVSQTRKVPPYVVIIPRAASGSLAHRRIGLITFYGQLTVIDHVIRVEARVAHWSSQPPFGFNDHHICGPIVSGLWSMRTLMPWGITAEEEMKFVSPWYYRWNETILILGLFIVSMVDVKQKAKIEKLTLGPFFNSSPR